MGADAAPPLPSFLPLLPFRPPARQDKLANFKKEFGDAEVYVDVLYKLFRRRKPRGEENKGSL